MSTNDWTPGTIVYLRSGSPALTVSDLPTSGPEYISVEWFDGCEAKYAVFPIVCLTQERPHYA